jgi:hypothetical protein
LVGSRPRATFDSILTPLIYPAIEVSLQASREGNDLILKWPVAATGYVLQISNDISSAANWLPASLDISVSGDLNVVRVSMTQGQRWFRLVHN